MRQEEFSLPPDPFPPGFSHSSTRRSKVHGAQTQAGHTVVHLETQLYLHGSRQSPVLFCGREQMTAWDWVSFPCDVFICPQAGMPRQENQPRKGREANKGPYNQTLTVEKVQTWMQFSPAQPSRQVRAQLENTQKGCLPHLRCRGITPTSEPLREQEVKPQLLHQTGKMLSILSLVPAALIKTMTKCNLGKKWLTWLTAPSEE